MAAKSNAFALLEGDDGETPLAILSTASVKPGPPQPAVDKRTQKTKKDGALFQSSSAPQQSSDYEKGREKNNNINGIVERQNRNSFKGSNRDGVERQNRNLFQTTNGQENGNDFRKNNSGGRFYRDNSERKNRNGFEQSNGQENAYRRGLKPAVHSLKRHDGNSNGNQKKEILTNDQHKKEETSNDDGWQLVVRSNPHKQSNANHNHVEVPRKGNVNERERNYGRKREFNNDNESLATIMLTDNAGNDTKEYRKSRENRGRYGRGEVKFNGERGGNYRHRKFANAAEEKLIGKSSESTELPHDKEVQNAGEELVSNEPGSSKVKHDKVLSKEEIDRMQKREAERELEAKQMTLKQYEKHLEEKRKGLESLKAGERRVALDKEFESMQMIEKKKEETNFVKNSANDKLKKKVGSNKEDNKVKYIITTHRRPRTNNSGMNAAAASDRPQAAGSAVMSVKLAFRDAEQFPALDGSSKSN